MASDSASADFFISYTRSDRNWAEWISWQLEDLGCRTVLDAWDFTPGRDWAHEMHRATQHAARILVVLSRKYTSASAYGEAEWRTAFAKDPSGELGILLPVRVEDFLPEGLLRTRIYVDLVGLDEGSARQRLESCLAGGRTKPATPPRYPGRPALATGPEPAFPGGGGVDVTGGVTSPFRADVGLVGPPASSRERIVRTCAHGLTRLLSLQYPWGEWSDQRSELESRIAERRPRGTMEPPKPNVARTLFAIEATGRGTGAAIVESRRKALVWMRQGVRDGWYWEWQVAATPHSETVLHELHRRADIRHTAQVASTLARWGGEPQLLGVLIRSLSTSALPDSGFWSDTPGSSVPRILATCYVIEAFAATVGERFQPGLDALVGSRVASGVRVAFRRGLSALLLDVEEGAGLLGGTNSVANAYISALTLFRLAPFVDVHQDVLELVGRLVDGLSATAEEWGWEDRSVHEDLRRLTRNRTTLRAAAGLARAAGTDLIDVSGDVLALARGRVTELMAPSAGWPLDSPDYACGLICLLELETWLDIDALCVSGQGAVDALIRQHTKDWEENTRDLLRGLSFGRRLGLSGYHEVWAEYADRLVMLESAT